MKGCRKRRARKSFDLDPSAARLSRERLAKGDIAATPTGRRVMSAMDRYREQGKLDALQVQAADMLFEDWSRSGLDPWASKMGEGTSGGANPAVPGCGPRWPMYRRAMECLMPLEQHVVRLVVIEDRAITELTRADQRKTMWTILRDGLDQLVAHYGLARNPVSDHKSASSQEVRLGRAA